MEQPAASDRIEELLAHRAWVQRVARALVLDESRAEDLEQEAWLRAVRTPPPRPSRAWLGTVLRNAAVNLRLAERRRSAHESSVPPSGEGPSPAELLERAEIVERVARAVRTLEEPYRTAVLLRWFEDLSPPAIAARLEVPLETVRTRLRRALVRLREELDREHNGDRRKWALLLLPLARRPEPAAGGAALSAGLVGGLVMTLKAKAAVGAAVLLLLAGVAWRVRSSEEVPPDGTGSVAAAPAIANAGPAVAVPAPAGEIPAAAPAVSAAPRPLLVVDPDGRPVAGAVVESLRFTAAGVNQKPAAAEPLGRTDAEGRLAWPEGEAPFPRIVRARHADHAPGEAVASSRDAEVVLRLRRAMALHGTVVDEDGAPVAGAAVTARVNPAGHVLGVETGVTGTWNGEAASGADGAFRIAGLPPAFEALVSASAEGRIESRVLWRVLDGRSPRLVLERRFRSSVHVRDGAGRPVEGASVFVFAGPRIAADRLAPPWEREVLPLPAAEPGLYARDDLPAGWYQVLVAAKGHRLAIEEHAAFGRDLPAVEIALDATPGVRGRVVWFDTKEPVAGVRVRATPLRKVHAGADPSAAQVWQRPVAEMDGPFVTTTGADGAYELPVFAPTDVFSVQARGDDGEYGFAQHPGHGRPESAEVHDIWLHRTLKEVDFFGRVVSTTGEPIPGAVVQGLEDVVAAGPDGRFRLVSRQAGLNVEVMAPGFSRRSVYSPGNDRKGGGFGVQDFGDIVLAPVWDVRIAVADAEGKPVPGLALHARPADRDAMRRLFTEFGFDSATGLSDAEGRAVLRLVPGHRYEVRLFDAARTGAAEWDGVSREDVRLVVGPDPRNSIGTIRGRLRLEDGSWRPCRVTVGLRPATGGSSGGLAGAVDPEGAFEIPGVPSGRWNLRVSGSEDVEGELAGVAVVAGGVADAAIPCRWLRKEGDADAELAVRPEPAPEKPESLLVFATRQPSGASGPLAAGADAAWRGTVRTGSPVCLFASDAQAMRAGTAVVPHAGGGEPVSVKMAAAGLLIPPGWSHGRPEPWVEVRDAAGVVVYSGGLGALPVVPDRGYALVLPPGEYRIEVSVGAERKEPRTFTATAVAGAAKRVE